MVLYFYSVFTISFIPLPPLWVNFVTFLKFSTKLSEIEINSKTMQLAEFNIFVSNLIGFVQIQKIGHDSVQKLNKDNIRTFLSIVLISSSSGVQCV